MNLLVLTIGDLRTASVRYRLIPLLERVHVAGIRIRVRPVRKSPFKRLALIRHLVWADNVLIQKKLFGAFEIAFIRALAGRVFYDLDDAVHFPHPSSGTDGKAEKRFQKTGRDLKNMIRATDGVIVGNESLKGIVESLGHGRVAVIPTPVDTHRYVPRPPSGGDIILGWIGTGENIWYLDRIGPTLARIQEEHENTKVLVISDREWSSGVCRTEFAQWSYEGEVDLLSRIHIGLMPLTDDPFSRGKCGFKLLQYMSMGIPAVASPVGANSSIISHGVDGYLAANQEDWVVLISSLVRDEGMRAEMGCRAREKVVGRFSTERLSEDYAGLLREWIRSGGG